MPEFCEHVDCIGEVYEGFEDEQQLRLDLLQEKYHYSLADIKRIMSEGALTFNQLLERFEETLVGWIDDEAQAILRILHDGAYLYQVWSWIMDKDDYKQWVQIYLENKQQLEVLAAYYISHDDYGFDLRNSAIEAKNELYLAQTMPGEPANLDYDPYTGAYEEKDTVFLSGESLDGDPNYDRYHFSDDDLLFDDRGVSSVPINQSTQLELTPREYPFLRHSDVGIDILKLRELAISFRRQNFKQRHPSLRYDFAPDQRDSDQRVLRITRHKKAKYLTDDQLEALLKSRVPLGLANIKRKLTDLMDDNVPVQDILLLLYGGIYLDFLAREIKIPAHLGMSTQNLEAYAVNFADEIFDYAWPIQDPPGWYPSNEVYYADILEKDPFLQSIPYDESKTEWSRLFNEVVLEHIFAGKNVNEAYKQAYHACKMAQSPKGEQVYRKAIASGTDYGQAMHRFYEAAYAVGDLQRPRDRVITVFPEKMIVLTASSEYQGAREINWKIAKIKADNNELYIPIDAKQSLKQRLFNAVISMKWSPQTIQKLRQ